MCWLLFNCSFHLTEIKKQEVYNYELFMSFHILQIKIELITLSKKLIFFIGKVEATLIQTLTT